MLKLILNNVEISNTSSCYVIAEIGHNHQGNLENCKKLFLEAKLSGANAVKLQKRNNKKLYTKSFYNSPYNNPNSYGETYGLHREFLEFDKDQYQALKKYAKEIDITFFATPFDFDSVDFLEEINLPFYKIASADVTNLPLIDYVASKKKPIIFSTGGCTEKDIERVYNHLKKNNSEFALLHCISSYPTPPELVNLELIPYYKKKFNCIVGFSSHDNGPALSLASYVKGARIIEKHFTLDRSLKGTDHAMSLAPSGLRKLIKDLRKTEKALGNGVKTFQDGEKEPIKKMAKKIVSSKSIKKGTIIQLEHLEFKSPGDGLPPYLAYEIIGKKLTKDVEHEYTFQQGDFS
jgi:N-acetylneuraminate synthase/sialic acid synthase